MAELSVELSADIKKLIREIDKGQDKLEDFGDSAGDAQKRLDRLGGRSTANAAKGITNVRKNVANTTPTLLEFNRVVQDAPFGIQGVANNLTQLTQNFGQLKQQAGGTVPALRSLAAGFAGPAGLLFAVSAVTSILVTYGDELFRNTSLTKEFNKATNDLIASALAEASNAESLLSIAQNIALSYATREKALDELNEKYPEYLENLTLENINSKEAANAVNTLTNSLINQAKVRGIQTALESRIANNSSKLTKGLIERQRAARAVEAEISRLVDKYGDFINVEGTTGLGQRTTRVFEQINQNLGGSTAGIGDRLLELVKDFENADKGVENAEKNISSSISELQAILNNFNLQNFGLDPTIELEGVTVSAGQSSGTTTSIQSTGVLENTRQELEKIFGVTKELQDSINDQWSKFNSQLAQQYAKNTSAVKAYRSDYENQIASFNAEIANLFNSTAIATAAQNFGQQIGNGLAQGQSLIQSIGNSLIGLFGDFLSKMGGLLIKYGSLAVAKGKLDLAIQAVGPVSIGAGIAAIAVGTALTAAGAALSRGASSGFGGVGGQGSSSSFQGSNYSAQYETVSRGDFLENLRIEIEGTKLIAVQNRVNSIRRRNNSSLF